MLDIDYKNIILFSVSLITAYLSLVIIRDRAKYDNTVFSLFILSVSFWALGLAFFNSTTNINWAIFFVKSYYISAAAIPLFFTLFSISFPYKKQRINTYQNIMLVLFFGIASLIVFYPDFIFKTIILGEGNSVILEPRTYFVYFAYFVSLMVFSYFNLLRSFFTARAAENIDLARRIAFIGWGTFIPFAFGMFFNLILPLITYDYIWIGPIAALVVVFVVLYSINKFKLFNTKVVFAEFFTFIICLLILLKALTTTDSAERTSNFVLLFIIVFFGFFLIQSVRKESDNNEKIKDLADNLLRSNTKLEKTNLKLKELDEKKSEFMSLATHQLRAPLTAMRGYSSMILDGTFGKVGNPEIEDAIDKISRSTTDLTMIVEDYLNISRIEQGRMQYNFSIFDITDTIKNIIKEVQVNIDRAGLTIALHHDQKTAFKVNVDEGKIKQVLFNLIDNASKYTKKGGIDIYVTKVEDSKVQIEIKDTGVGIKPEVLPTLFNKFVRAPDASKANILGTGLGLYVASQIIQAHNGRAWAESAGAGKGSSFFVELGMVA